MKRYFGLSNREENLVVYNTLLNSLLNSLIVVPLVYFGYCIFKAEGFKTFFENYTKNANIWNYAILVYGSFKVLSFLFETYYVGKASLNLAKVEKNHNNF